MMMYRKINLIIIVLVIMLTITIDAQAQDLDIAEKLGMKETKQTISDMTPPIGDQIKEIEKTKTIEEYEDALEDLNVDADETPNEDWDSIYQGKKAIVNIETDWHEKTIVLSDRETIPQEKVYWTHGPGTEVTYTDREVKTQVGSITDQLLSLGFDGVGKMQAEMAEIRQMVQDSAKVVQWQDLDAHQMIEQAQFNKEQNQTADQVAANALITGLSQQYGEEGVAPFLKANEEAISVLGRGEVYGAWDSLTDYIKENYIPPKINLNIRDKERFKFNKEPNELPEAPDQELLDEAFLKGVAQIYGEESLDAFLKANKEAKTLLERGEAYEKWDSMTDYVFDNFVKPKSDYFAAVDKDVATQLLIDGISLGGDEHIIAEAPGGDIHITGDAAAYLTKNKSKIRQGTSTKKTTKSGQRRKPLNVVGYVWQFERMRPSVDNYSQEQHSSNEIYHTFPVPGKWQMIVTPKIRYEYSHYEEETTYHEKVLEDGTIKKWKEVNREKIIDDITVELTPSQAETYYITIPTDDVGKPIRVPNPETEIDVDIDITE